MSMLKGFNFTAAPRAATQLTPEEVDLSRISAAPSARLSHFSFKSDRAFPPQG